MKTATLINGKTYVNVDPPLTFLHGVPQDVPDAVGEMLARETTHDPRDNVVPRFRVAAARAGGAAPKRGARKVAERGVGQRAPADEPAEATA